MNAPGEGELAPPGRVLCFATQGSGHGDERRILALLERIGAEPLPFDRARRLASALGVLRRLLLGRPDLVVMEGTGVAGGAAVIAARLLAGVPYVVSSGDAVGPHVGLSHRGLAPFAALYERLLCRLSAGFVGWSPYLVGRALTLGAPRAMTAANWAAPARPEERERRREQLGIPAGAIVFGLLGSLEWNDRAGYCYGLELVRAIAATERDDLRVLVVGDGSGLARLRATAGASGRVILPGRVAPEEVPACLAAIDVASLPQSVDGVGSFRYTTKLSEYLAAGLPVVTGQIPLAYDLDDGWLWRLPGESPWDPRYLEALAELMRTLDRGQLERRRAAVPRALPLFDRERQQQLAAEFLSELIAARRPRGAQPSSSA